MTLHLDDTPIVNHAANIVNSGNIVAHDPIFLDVFDKDQFYDMQYHRYYKGLQFPGFGFYIDSKTDDVSFQYLDFYPILLAVSYATLGSEAFLYLTPVIALLSIIALYSVIRVLFSWKTALVSVFLLSINLSQIFFSRYPGTEMFNQLLVFSAVLSIILLIKHRSVFFAFLTSMVFGTLLMVRIDSLAIGLVMVFLVIVLEYLKYDNRILYVLLGTFFLFNIFSVLHIHYFDKAYFHDQFIIYLPRLGFGALRYMVIEYNLLIYMAPSLLTLVFYPLFVRTEIIRFLRQHAPQFSCRKLLIITSFFIAISFLILYLTRYPFSDSIIGAEQTLLIIQWFLTPVGLLFAIAGLMMIINDNILTNKRPNTVRLISLISYLLIVIPNIVMFIFITLGNQPLFPWAFRRYVPVVFPFFIICTAYSIGRLSELSSQFHLKHSNKQKYLRKSIYLGLVAIICTPMIYMDIDSGILINKEFYGLIEKIEEFSSNFDDNSIILFYRVDTFSGISVPMKYFYNKNTILMPHLTVDDNFFYQIDYWRSEGRHVYLITDNPSDISTKSLDTHATHHFEYMISYPKMKYVRAPPVGSKPYGETYSFQRTFYVYEIR